MIVRVHPSISALRMRDHAALDRRGPLDTGQFLGQVQALLSVPRLVRKTAPGKDPQSFTPHLGSSRSTRTITTD